MNTALKIIVPVVVLLLILAVYQQSLSQARIASLQSIVTEADLQRAEDGRQTLQLISELQNYMDSLESRISVIESGLVITENQDPGENSNEPVQGQSIASQSPDRNNLEDSITSTQIDSDTDMLNSIQIRANQLIERSRPESALQHLEGLTEANLNIYLDTVAMDIARQEDEGANPNRLQALTVARDQLSDQFSEGQVAIIDSYIEIFELQQNQAIELEQSLLQQLRAQ